jgi:hypothetical protein
MTPLYSSTQEQRHWLLSDLIGKDLNKKKALSSLCARVHADNNVKIIFSVVW